MAEFPSTVKVLDEARARWREARVEQPGERYACAFHGHSSLAAASLCTGHTTEGGTLGANNVEFADKPIWRVSRVMVVR